MHHYLVAGATILASVAGTASAKGLSFKGFPSTGTYQDVASFDLTGSPKCSFQPYTYTGASAPLDEEWSAIFRGPIKLKQFAIYTQAGGKQKRSPRQSVHHRRHGHQHFHEHNKEIREAAEHEDLEERGYGDLVTATIDGKVVQFTDTWDAPDHAAAPTPAAPAPPVVKVAAAMGTVTPAAPPPKKVESVNAGAGNWARTGYYDAASATAQGITFLANNNWANYATLGAALGFVGADGKSKASGPSILEDCLIPDNVEFVISSDTPCVKGDSCGVTAPGVAAHHGFAGDKMFMVEFQMPMSGSSDGYNPDMPAFWLLNSKIVNTQQYDACSCWKSGCGEWDIHEVLTKGAKQGSASMHMGKNFAGTPSQTFDRPVGKTMKMAAIVSNGVAHIEVLDDGTTFDKVIKGSQVSGYLNHPEITEFNVLLGSPGL